jgi:hypothetical protein
MKHTASAKKSSSASASSTRRRKAAGTGRRFAVCLDNRGYDVSLERNKIYLVVPDKEAEKGGDLRVVDESGEATYSRPIASSRLMSPQPSEPRF